MQHLHKERRLLLPVAGAKAHANAHVLAARPLARIDRNPLVAQHDEFLLARVLKRQRVHQQAQFLDRLSEVPRNQFDPLRLRALQHRNAACRLVQRVRI